MYQIWVLVEGTQLIDSICNIWVSTVTVGPGRNDRRPGDKELSTKNLAYRRDESYG